MLGTFDLDDVDFPSPDEILATLAPERSVSEADDPPQASPTDGGAISRDASAVEGVQSDEILRELEGHHRRGQTTPRASAPRGSAELQPALRRNGRPTRERVVRGRAFGESKLRVGRGRLVFWLAVAAVFTATVSALTLSQLGGRTNRTTSPLRSSGLATTTGLALTPTKVFDTVANAIVKDDRQLTRRVKSPVGHHLRVATVRGRSIPHRSVTHAPVAPAASTSPTSSTPSYSNSSSTAASSSQPATSTAATAASSSTSHQSQPAFGQDGSLGPGRGAAGTQ